MKTIREKKEEKEILEAFESGTLKSVKNKGQEIKKAHEAANLYLTKNSRINIRIAGADLSLLKRKAAQEGMPYQTLIASLLHKYAVGSL